METPVPLMHLTQAPPEEQSLEGEAQVEVGNMKGGFSQWGSPRSRERKELEWIRDRTRGISARGGDAQPVGRDAGSQQAGQHNANELQQRQPQGSRGNIKHVAADEG